MSCEWNLPSPLLKMLLPTGWPRDSVILGARPVCSNQGPGNSYRTGETKVAQDLLRPLRSGTLDLPESRTILKMSLFSEIGPNSFLSQFPGGTVIKRKVPEKQEP
jgi:hypothetical protein